LCVFSIISFFSVFRFINITLPSIPPIIILLSLGEKSAQYSASFAVYIVFDFFVFKFVKTTLPSIPTDNIFVLLCDNAIFQTISV